MTTPCLDLVGFADGELEPARADAFRAHLRTCADCRVALLEALQLGTRLATLTPTPEHVTLVPEPRAEPPATLVSVPMPLAPRLKRVRRLAPWTGLAVAVAAVVAWLVPKPPAAVDAFATLTDRPSEIRLAYAGAQPYRPVRSQMRSGHGAPAQSISYAALAALQERHDGHGLAVARAWNGDAAAKVAAQLREVARTPAVRSDIAAFESLARKPDDVESVLTELEQLRTDSDPAVARAARWNYAILLARLDLPLGAAQAFRAIAAEQEAGWADEARVRAVAEDNRAHRVREAWRGASDAGAALLATGAPVPGPTIRAIPGMMRAYFYHAVRAAPSRERVVALAAMAGELDRFGDSPILRAYVERVSKADFRRRAPLASAYARLLGGAQLTPEAAASLVARASAAGAIDIAMGVLVQLDRVADHRDAFHRMTVQTGDPWFEIQLAKAEASVDVQRGDWLGAQARLRAADKLCDASVLYQCLQLHRQLGELYAQVHRVHDALGVMQAARRSALSAGEWGEMRSLLWQLADLQRLSSSTATARAYADEVLLMSEDDCAYQASALRTLTGAALLDVDGRAARRYLESTLQRPCAHRDLAAANYLTDIARLDPQPGDGAQLQGWLNTLRAHGALSDGQRVLADEIEGRFLVERERPEGIALLERAIAAADARPPEVVAEKARTGAYSVLALDAAHAGDYPGVLALVARELGLPGPRTCAVAMLAEDERSVVVVRGAQGPDRGAYDADRRSRGGELIVPPELVVGLEACAHVQVLAQGALQGQPRVLPPRVAWSYATGARRAPLQATPDTEPQTLRLIVANVTPPADLDLPALAPYVPEPGPSTLILDGPLATPARVLAAMRDVREVQFHTHALVNMGISDASSLILSPGTDGQYALTAEAIRGAELRGQPLIILAACNSAQGARYQHAAWSLPHAFLSVGARAVFAAGTAIPDREAGPFFARVLARIHVGGDAAAALRDERMTALATNRSTWVADVMLFE